MAAAGSATGLGYTYLVVFQGGMPEWSGKGYPVNTGKKPGTFPGAH